MMRWRRPEHGVPHLSSHRGARCPLDAEPRVTSWLGSSSVFVHWPGIATVPIYGPRIKHGHIRDCNKTTDVRTTDSRTGIVPLNTTPSLSFPSSLFLRPSTYSFPSPCPSDTLRLFPSNASVHCLPANLSTTSLIGSPSPSLSSSPSPPRLFLYRIFSPLPSSPSIRISLSHLTDYRERERGRRGTTWTTAPFPLEKWRFPAEVSLVQRARVSGHVS